ncbi:hypothetical protein FNV43_RR23910 [Rhamnella rubrinervis]|uniref:Longin domain-containing protein n=1 Tax=Rhamnella rubrinervis TaxID=2594499 RepID=A0A8K0GQ89_9ROSA|nr:hypothetical protein FNV43_RR23910 [Rhamnella rubrinervis]
MISNPNLIYYACIAKNTTILAEFSREADLEALGRQCIEKAPPFHSMFSHSVRERTYTFFIDDSFVYFAIFAQDLDQSEVLWFLNRLKSAFQESVKSGSMMGSDNFSYRCFQAEFDSIIGEIMALSLDLVDSPPMVPNCSRNPSLDSSKGKKMVLTPLLGNPSKGLKKKKRLSGEANGDFGKDLNVENKLVVSDNVDGVCSRDFSLSMQKNVTLHIGDRQKAKQVWRKHVWVVLLLDLFICAVLFGIWLWVCRGFKCIDS